MRAVTNRWKSDPNRFGAVAFGILGLLFGLLKMAPWDSAGFFLAQAMVAKFIWVAVFAALAGALGHRFGMRFIDLADERRTANAAGIAACILSLASAGVVLLYCLALIAIGDFGVSLGVFGSFQPPYSLLQKLAGTLVVGSCGFLLFVPGAVVIGFIGGYAIALLLNPYDLSTDEDDDG